MLIQSDTNHIYTWSNFSLADIHRQPYWVFDLEAMGIDYAFERVIQVGWVEAGRVVEDSAFASFVCPDKPIPDAIKRLTGISQRGASSSPNAATSSITLFWTRNASATESLTSKVLGNLGTARLVSR